VKIVMIVMIVMTVMIVPTRGAEEGEALRVIVVKMR